MILACSVQSPVSYRKHTGSSGQPNGSCHKEERLKRRRERASDREGKEGGSGERWWCVGLVKQPCNAMLKILISIAKENACTHLKIVYAPYTFASEGKLKLD